MPGTNREEGDNGQHHATIPSTWLKLASAIAMRDRSNLWPAAILAASAAVIAIVVPRLPVSMGTHRRGLLGFTGSAGRWRLTFVAAKNGMDGHARSQ